ncbi:hypothetical protein [Paraburkholderia heleia]|uniref:hypothetical protein n=1 Tax=Paraburkholderia heleia TaxID=634127 RepID=UPI0031D53E49
MNEIFWPEDDLPGTADCCCSNEVTVAGLSMADVWPLPGGRALTQVSQKGKPAVTLVKTRPNPVFNGHRDWLDGRLVDTVHKAQGARQ